LSGPRMERLRRGIRRLVPRRLYEHTAMVSGCVAVKEDPRV
jgi:hypothetical protein